MKQYLPSIVQPDGDPPPPHVLEPIMRDVQALDAPLAWARKAAKATTLPIDVRPFRGDVEG